MLGPSWVRTRSGSADSVDLARWRADRGGMGKTLGSTVLPTTWDESLAGDALRRLDALPALEALATVDELRTALWAVESETMARARAEGHSWRSIAAATRLTSTTVRRWAARTP